MQIGFLSLLQFLLDPLQYFSSTRIGIIPGLYLGRILSAFIIISLAFSPKYGSKYLLTALKSVFLSRSYFLFSWVTLLASVPVFLFSRDPSLWLRYGFLEPAANIIYLAIFSVLPSLISTASQRFQLSKYFYRYLFFVIGIGFLDFILYFLGVNFLGHSLFDRVDVGSRFHSLFSEPRDYAVASVYLISLLAVFNISNLSHIGFPKLSFNIKLLLLFLLTISPFLAKSATFITGFVLFLCSLLFFILFLFLTQFKSYPRFLLLFIFLLITSLVGTYIIGSSLIFDARVVAYYENLSFALSSLSSADVIDSILSIPLLRPQASTFLPIITFFNDISFGTLYHSLFGYGHGYVNNIISTQIAFDDTDIYNSYAGLPRLLCETGFIGLLSFAYMFFDVILRPFRLDANNLIFSNLKSKYTYFILSIMLFCMYLVHRRQELFLYMGFVNCYLFQPPLKSN